MHWPFMNGECILGYFYKKQSDCDYKLGDTDISPDVRLCSNIPGSILSLSSFLVGLYISVKLDYNVLLYVILTIGPRLVKNLGISDPIFFKSFWTPILSIYFLKDNKYLLPGLVILLGSTLIVHHKDQNSCIVGTQVTEDEIESTELTT